ncbi:MAG: long-chain acyl-CoA synthetase [Actinoplanes sp.]|nr:long-chain acyl-CoA synthetase [Actinoplanes sp.]
MTGSILNHIVANPPPVGARIEFFRLGGAESMELADLWARAGRLALALRGLGVGRGDRVGILAGNSVEWVLLDLAALRMGAVTVGFDPAKFPVDDALIGRYGLRLLFAAGQGGAPGVLPTSDVWRLIDSSTPDKTLPVIGYAPDDVTTVKLTSGSTGEPKGLTTSAGSIDSALHAVQEMFAHGPGDNLFVFLPLAVLQQRYWIYSALRFGHDVTVSTYEAAFPALGRARPTVVMGVPGFFDTARRHIEAQARRAGPAADPDEAVRGAATRLFGDRIRYLWTGSAPAAAGTLRFFTDAGLPIFEGYGLNETCIVSKNHPGANRVGSVGRMLPGKEVVLDADGVISVRSDHPVCHGYEYAEPGVSQRGLRRRRRRAHRRPRAHRRGRVPVHPRPRRRRDRARQRAKGRRPADRGAPEGQPGHRGVRAVLSDADVPRRRGVAGGGTRRRTGHRRSTRTHQRGLRRC